MFCLDHLTMLDTILLIPTLQTDCKYRLLVLNMATDLQQACEVGNVEEVKKLVSKKKNLNATDKRGWTALHCAANKASEKENFGNPAFLIICQMLLKVRLFPMEQARSSLTPLQGGRGSHDCIKSTLTEYAIGIRC